MKRLIKKTSCDVECTVDHNENKARLYRAIHEYAEAGYSNRSIAKLLDCSRSTVNRYMREDFDTICRRDYHSGVDRFYDYIIKELSAGVSRGDVYYGLIAKGYKGKRTAAYEYMNNIIRRFRIDIAMYRSSSAEAIRKKKQLQKYDHISGSGVFRFLWMNEAMPQRHLSYLLSTHPAIGELRACVLDFRAIFKTGSMPMLYLFIERYKSSNLKEIASFARGLENDMAAVENAVASPLSNGFVEGSNNKLKMVKRTMYGRCSKQLLEAKLMFTSRFTSFCG